MISTKGFRKTNSRVKKRLRLSLKRGGTSDLTDIIIIDLREILQGSLSLPTLMRLILCFEK